ncbi:hypothetical protein SKAU_G00316460 [Synaphobranchus kaupii]|uniref:ITPR-interacting domain-containing protein n=1 Tax=Synaphobranchus kaupii TaxID=118154 RepID=A0A9Q1EST3_SYNKA|nr:hypothetical protein SKAU_G00316460 [Synaphobranchus kaupii]
MENPSPTDRRQAWVRSSRHWLTLEDTDPQEPHLPTTSDTLPDDDVFSEGCCAGKIENWLQGCGPEQGSEDPGHMTVEPVLRASCSFEDDLSLGAEATVLNIAEDGPQTGTCPLLLPPPRPRQKGPDASSLQQKLSLPFVNLGNSMASSGLSSDTSKTASSVTEVLQLCSEDAEETLYQLGFGCDEPQVPARIPARFFSFPSQLQGINFRVFLESQLRRLREEDPCLTLASRFRQVEVLTAMANAFYSLYSHVSRTPLQKLAPPELSLSPAESKIGQRFFGSVRSEPRSPVERFKDTVSKMCLYTGSSRGSDPASPRKRNSLPDVVGMVIGGVTSEGSRDQEAGDQAQGMGGDEEGRREPGKEEGAGGGVERGVVRETDSKRATSPDLDRIRYLAAVRQRWSNSADFRLCSKPSPGSDPARPTVPLTSRIEPRAGFSPIPKITQDIICPQITETVRLAPFSCLQQAPPLVGDHRRDTPTDPSDCRGGSATEQAVPKTGAEMSGEINKRARDEPCSTGIGPLDPAPVSVSLLAAEPSPCITVTGWEGDVAVGYADTPGYVATAANQPAPTSDSGGSQNHLSPTKAPYLGQVHSPSDQQANSFELEEVHSAGEEDAGLTDRQTVMTSTPLSAVKRHRDVILKGDSLQSDSSGYAEEDGNPSSP